jgi:hypothetical protein
MNSTGDSTHDPTPGRDATWEDAESPEATDHPPDERGPHTSGASPCCDGHDAG